MTQLLAHGIGGVKDFPVPLWLVIFGAATALVLSFVALAVLWRRPVLEDREGTPLPPALQRFLVSRVLRVVLGAVGFGLLVVVGAAALAGDASSGRNLAPTFVYVVFWLGLVPVVVFFGNVWRALNPWAAAADACAWLARTAGIAWEAPLRYPERLGRWPAAVLIFAFAALELAYQQPADPRALAIAIVLYSWITWVGMAAFGTQAWLANGEAFNVYFGLLARLAPFARRGDVLVRRAPLSGLAARDARPGTLAFVAVMLGSVAFDGLSRSTWWLDRRASVAAANNAVEVLLTALNLAGLLLGVIVVALAYLAASTAARSIVRGAEPLHGAFIWSLVPIGLAYVVAHYFSLFVLQGQFAIPLASDPFGFGWNLFGTADVLPNLRLLTPDAVSYVQVGALVVGHVLGLIVAHDRALALFPNVRTALSTQYAFLTLMVLYTVGGLWLLSRG